MALTKIGKEGITGVSNSADATFLTATSGEGVTLAGTLAVTGVHTVGTNAIATSDGGAATTSIVQGLAKCWINLEQGSSHTTRDSFNVSGITDHDAGETIVAWANDMANINYVSSGMAGQDHTALLNISQPENEHAPTTGNAQYNCSYANSNNFDATYFGVVIHGDLA